MNRTLGAIALAALILLAGYDDAPSMDGVAMCDTDAQCEQLRIDLCEAAKDDGDEASQWCQP